MNDQPPPTDKKPRRRSVPRKRTATRRATKPEAAAAEAAIEASASTSTEVAHGVDVGITASSTDVGTDAVAVRLDPAPLAEPGGRGDARASNMQPSLDATPDRTAARGRSPEGATSNDAPRDDTSIAPGARVESATSATTTAERAAPRSPRGDGEAAEAPPSLPAPQTATPASAAPDAAPMRQPSLRAGELIRVPLSVRWRDLDAFNHVNNSKYLSYLEEARLRWMLSVPGMGMDEDVAPVVAASNLNYRRPIGWPGDVVIELFVERVGGSSLTVGHRIVDATDGRCVYCDGNVVMVWIDRRTGRSAPLPDGVRTACT